MAGGHDHRHAERVEIRGRAGLAHNLLHREEPEGADRGRAHRRAEVQARLDSAEVDQERAPVARQDDVARLDVAVDERGVEPVEVGEHVEEGAQDRLEREPGERRVVVDPLLQRSALDVVLHEDQRQRPAALLGDRLAPELARGQRPRAVVGEVLVVTRDVWVVDRGEHPRLAFEQLERLPVRHPIDAQHLEVDRRAVVAEREERVAEAARADRAIDGVAVAQASDGLLRREDRLHRPHEGTASDEPVATVMLRFDVGERADDRGGATTLSLMRAGSIPASWPRTSRPACRRRRRGPRARRRP